MPIVKKEADAEGVMAAVAALEAALKGAGVRVLLDATTGAVACAWWQAKRAHGLCALEMAGGGPAGPSAALGATPAGIHGWQRTSHAPLPLHSSRRQDARLEVQPVRDEGRAAARGGELPVPLG